MLFDSPFVRLPLNSHGRDFCIGDLHGCRQMLDRLLEAVGFDLRHDRLFSVGDLIHRGPESAACLCLAEQPWFFPVLGNHEAMQIAAYAGDCWVEDGRIETGLEYLADTDPKVLAREHLRYQAILAGLPLAIEIPLRDGRRVGIAHASLRSPYRWADVESLYRCQYDLDRPGPSLQARLLWDRLPADAAFAHASPEAAAAVSALDSGQRRELFAAGQPIPDIDLLISGHCQTPGDQPVKSGMRLFLDTGAGWEDGWLSMVEIDTGHCWQVPDSRMFPEMPVRQLERYLEPFPDAHSLVAAEAAMRARTAVITGSWASKP